LRKDGNISELEIKKDNERIKNGFLASIREVQDEQYIANKTLTLESVLKMRLPVHIDRENESTSFGRFWAYSLAEIREKVLNKKLQHFWILSGGCNMSWMTSICCELANCTSDIEALEWEKENFKDLSHLTKKIVKTVEEHETSQ